MLIRLSVSDSPHRETVTVYLEGRLAHGLAAMDQTIHGSRWEAPSDMPTVAYACLSNEPDLPRTLEAEGYTITESNWEPPIWECKATCCDGGVCCPVRDYL